MWLMVRLPSRPPNNYNPMCVLDLEMPELDGVEAARQISRTVATKVIICTRHARPGGARPWPKRCRLCPQIHPVEHRRSHP